MHALASFVAEVWSAHLAPANAIWFVPDGCMDLVFRDGADAELFWVGPMTRAEIITLNAPALFLGVRFRPGAAPAFVGLDARDLHGAAQPTPRGGGAPAVCSHPRSGDREHRRGHPRRGRRAARG